MPKVLIFNDCWIFIIWDTDINENKKHVHVGKKATKNLCKIWIDMDVEILPGKNFDGLLDKKVFACRENNGFINKNS